MYNPVATYRIQFNKEFTFADFEQVISYLQSLGIRTLYASPVFTSTPGSTHGYDGIDPHQINPEIGTEDKLRSIAARLKENGIGWLQDIVPNHMAFHPGNGWLMDVLKHGKESAYAGFFDILWDKEEKIMVPFLGTSLEEAIEKGELKITLQQEAYYLSYYNSHYPLNDTAIGLIKQQDPDTETAAPDNYGPELVKQIADLQHYRLCHWQETDRHINYRRFFTVNGLICLNIQDKKVFEQYHQLIATLLKDGVFSGLRIDHIDGLYDPAGYLEQLGDMAGNPCYTIVEKILEPGEQLPRQWPVQGTTGYDFLSLVNNLLTNKKALHTFTGFYNRLAGAGAPIEQQIREKKAHILHQHMAGELDNLCQLFLSSGISDKLPSYEVLKETIGEFLVHCPVYRYYGNTFPLDQEDELHIRELIGKIEQTRPDLKEGTSLLSDVLQTKDRTSDEIYCGKVQHFYQRCMQFTGPLMAKGVEDTLMYTYNRFIGHNDVGDSPEAFGISKEEFHQSMLERQRHWPLTLNATSTHDTKRGEDVRARLNVLTDLPDDWIRAVKKWRQLNAALKQDNRPDANDEYFIYQTLAGAFPLDDADPFEERLQEYLLKALREAKQHSNWTAPDEAYEAAVKNFISGLMKNTAFLEHFKAFLEKIADHGIINSLAQVLLKFTCPGIPDLYQGTELWDFSLVDPDNRRPVDYKLRSKLLDNIAGDDEQVKELWDHRKDARIKLRLVHTLLRERSNQQQLFAEGTYIPLRVEGKQKDHVLAFARQYQKEWVIVAVPLHTAVLSRQQDCDPLSISWGDTFIVLKPEMPLEWQSLLTGTSGKHDGRLLVPELFRAWPFAFLKMQHAATKRSAGVLASITSLPSGYGIGDFGPEAREFVRFLNRSQQSCWQLLPINPLQTDESHSPYSSVSTMAGNTLLISPDMLADEQLIDRDQLQQYRMEPGAVVDFHQAKKQKETILEIAYNNFRSGRCAGLKKEFAAFKEREQGWLRDFALYMVFKQQYHDQPWYQWPEDIKRREEDILTKSRTEHEAAMEQIMWYQFIFSRQWRTLRAYCKQHGIQLLGDLPFYASYDSADVWAHPDIFSIDKEGNMTGIAGVPPDYFSETGQLWGMPTFRWDRLKEQQYAWWIERLRKNLELYDLLRIDHFRALAGYWEVPAGEETAVNGKWMKGPGTDFFDAVEKALGKVPFIAEDLGYEMDDVYKLRDDVRLPGMKVLQFAFGENLPASVDAPHNYSENFIVYTGTHDNNTTLGWYRAETSAEDRQRLQQYAGCKVNERNVSQVMIKIAYASVANMVMIPVQDILMLDERARMNIPSSATGNWAWRMLPGQLTHKEEAWLRELTRLYNRI